MTWIRLALFCLFSMDVTGSFAYGLTLALAHSQKEKNPYLLLAWQKMTVLLFAFPFLFTGICISRVRFHHGHWSYLGSFLIDTTPLLDMICLWIGILWLIGFVASVIKMVYEQWKLSGVWKGNLEIRNPDWEALEEEYRQRFRLPSVKIYQNDLLLSPVTVGSIRPKIILPYRDYAEKQLRIMLEHEMNHIRGKDLLWRKIALLVTGVHWYNPLTYLLLRKLIYQEEVVCDLKSSNNNPWFTPKEYGYFLAGLEDNGFGGKIFTAFCESKKEIVRRVKAIAAGDKMKKPEKKMVAASCLCLFVLSFFPAQIILARAVKIQESWIKEEETAIEVKSTSPEPVVTYQTAADLGVGEVEYPKKGFQTEKDISGTYEIAANTRMLFGQQKMAEGESIVLTGKFEDAGLSCRIGIKNCETGEVCYVEKNGLAVYMFEIEKDGAYSAYIENGSDKNAEVEMMAGYLKN